jgi:hypothetical protein
VQPLLDGSAARLKAALQQAQQGEGTLSLHSLVLVALAQCCLARAFSCLQRDISSSCLPGGVMGRQQVTSLFKQLKAFQGSTVPPA